MGRGKFGPQIGPWTDIGTDDEWRGWWGPNPPFHPPVFVMTHHPRPSVEMEGGTVFHFVEGSPREVLERARQAAGDLDVRVGGGPTILREFLAEGLVDTMHLALVPIVRTRGPTLGWPRAAGGPLRRGGGRLSEQRHPPDLQPTDLRTLMAKLIFSATCSLDGYMAGPGGDMSWLTEHLQESNPHTQRLLAATGALLSVGAPTTATTRTSTPTGRARSVGRTTAPWWY
jgi:dihydrofolate reductase